MKRFRVYIINFIGFNKTEANATIILIGIALIFAIAPRVLSRLGPASKSTAESDQELLIEWLDEIDNSLKKKEIPKLKNSTPTQPKRFHFDPNFASTHDFQELGFKPFVASRIVKYRKAGGNFKTAKDLHKIFGIDSMLVAELAPYILIKSKSKTENSSIAKTVKKPHSEPEKAKKVWMDLNLATGPELQKIKGIGPFYAGNILKYRQKLGGYYAMEQLEEVYKMKPAILELLKNHTYINEPPNKGLPINSDSLKHLASHPYLSWNHAKVILNYRKQHGSFIEPEELLNIKIIDDSLYHKISPYISVEP